MISFDGDGEVIDVYDSLAFIGTIYKNDYDRYVFERHSNHPSGSAHIVIGQKLNELNGINPELLEDDDE